MINVERNTEAAARVYSKCLPKDPDKMHHTINNVLHSFRETGSFGPRLKINKLRRCNFQLTTEQVLTITILKLQLSTADMSEVWIHASAYRHLLHAHSAHVYCSTLIKAFMLSDHV